MRDGAAMDYIREIRDIISKRQMAAEALATLSNDRHIRRQEMQRIAQCIAKRRVSKATTRAQALEIIRKEIGAQ
jgi:hypothetical protein